MLLETIILAGGLGTRLKPIVDSVPKPLAPIGEKPFLDFLLEKLDQTKMSSRVILALGFGADKIQKYYSSKVSSFSFELDYSIESHPLGTGGAARLALEKTQGKDILIMNGDSIVDFNLHDFYAFHTQKKGAGSLLLTKVENCARYGAVFIDDAQKILKFEEKGRVGAGIINTGVYLFQKPILESWPLSQNLSMEVDILPKLISHPSGLFGYPTEASFIDIGTPESFAQAQNFSLLS